MDVVCGYFVWDDAKEAQNTQKHKIDFQTAVLAFLDPRRRVFKDDNHSIAEERLFCVGKVNGQVVTVRYTQRGENIRIIGAGYWRRGRKYYDEEKTHRS